MQITPEKFIRFDPIPQLRLKFKFNVVAFRLRTDAADKPALPGGTEFPGFSRTQCLTFFRNWTSFCWAAFPRL